MAQTCGDCGSEVATQDAFCGQCGRPVNGAPPPPAAPQPRTGDEPVPQARPSWPQTPALGQVSARPADPSGQAAAQARIRAGPGGQADADADAAAATADRESLAYGTADQARGVTEVEMIGRGNFDPLYNKWYSQQVLRQAGIFVGLWALIVPVSALFFLLIGLGGGASGVAGALSAWVKFSTLLSIVLAVLFWLIPVPALLSQRSRLISNVAGASQLVFRHVAAAFARHQTPLDMLQEKTMTPPGEGRRDYLELPPSSSPTPAASTPAAAPTPAGGTFTVTVAPAVAGQPGEQQVVSFLQSYFSAINAHNYGQYAPLVAPSQRPTAAQFGGGYGSTVDSAATLTGISPTGNGVAATVKFTSHQSPSESPTGTGCNSWRITLYLQSHGSGYRIGPAAPGYHAHYRPC